MPTPTPGSSQTTRQQLDELDDLLQKMLDLPLSQLNDPPPVPPPPLPVEPPGAATQPSPHFDPPPVRYEPPPPRVESYRPPEVPPAMPPTPVPAAPPGHSDKPVQPDPFDSSWRIELPGDPPPPPPPPSVFSAWGDPQWVPGQKKEPSGNLRVEPPPPTPDPPGPPSESKLIQFQSPLASSPETADETPPAGAQPPLPTPAPSPSVPIVPPAPAVSAKPSPEPSVPMAIHVPAPQAPPVRIEEPVLESPPIEWWAYPLVLLNSIVDRIFGLFGPPGRFLTTPTGRTLLGWTGVLMLVGAAGWAVADLIDFGWTW